jgi:hypothetical protein
MRVLCETLLVTACGWLAKRCSAWKWMSLVRAMKWSVVVSTEECLAGVEAGVSAEVRADDPAWSPVVRFLLSPPWLLAAGLLAADTAAELVGAAVFAVCGGAAG